MKRRTHNIGQAQALPEGTLVTLMGWVERQRDLGSLIFFRLRDRWGSIQVRVDQAGQPEAHAAAQKLRAEYVVAVAGTVVLRPAAERKHEPGGDREVIPQAISILAEAKTPPFYITEETPADDVQRMQYRYLDLRRPPMVRIMEIRHRAFFELRRYLDSLGFWEVETPMLTKSTPEGARDYLVPSRIHAGKFYALPQSPQLLKQLLMVAGVDRYFQLARCFRDEDPRADRQPEFTQLDLEMSFATREELFAVGEGSMAHIFRQAVGAEVKTPFPVLTYAQAQERFGSDKPDLRFGCEIRDYTPAFTGTEFRVFADAIAGGGVVRGLFLPGLRPSRKEEDELNSFVRSLGGGGVAVLSISGDESSGGLKKYVDRERLAALRELAQEEGDGAFLLMAGPLAKILPILGQLRVHAAAKFSLPRKPGFHFCWVVDFPLYEQNAETGQIEPKHHPFTSPLEEDLPLLDTEPLQVRADSYDMVLNGEEMGSGSLRVFDPALQRRILGKLGLSDEQITARFGFLMRAY